VDIYVSEVSVNILLQKIITQRSLMIAIYTSCVGPKHEVKKEDGVLVGSFTA
jgi:hypothetical protein